MIRNREFFIWKFNWDDSKLTAVNFNCLFLFKDWVTIARVLFWSIHTFALFISIKNQFFYTAYTKGMVFFVSLILFHNNEILWIFFAFTSFISGYISFEVYPLINEVKVKKIHSISLLWNKIKLTKKIIPLV